MLPVQRTGNSEWASERQRQRERKIEQIMFIKNGLREDKGQRACHNCIDLIFHEPINFIRWTNLKVQVPQQSK